MGCDGYLMMMVVYSHGEMRRYPVSTESAFSQLSQTLLSQMIVIQRIVDIRLQISDFAAP